MFNDPQGQDGFPHITYYDKSTELSFVYDGTKGQMIDVAHGGYAEPVKFRFPFPPVLQDRNMPVAKFMAHFATVCAEYARAYKAYGEPNGES